jgi:hypothetical protein
MPRISRPTIEPGTKLETVRRAATYSFPAAEIGQMLEEIERGYQDEYAGEGQDFSTGSPPSAGEKPSEPHSG